MYEILTHINTDYLKATSTDKLSICVIEVRVGVGKLTESRGTHEIFTGMGRKNSEANGNGNGNKVMGVDNQRKLVTPAILRLPAN
jgi:hypothetical protein